jgi:hypothetical protein
MKKLYVLSLGLGMAIGCALGIWYGRTFVNGLWLLNQMFAGSAAGTYSSTQYRSADVKYARQALLSSAQFLDDLYAVSPDRILKLDAGLSYGRLALLEEAEGKREESQAYFETAEARLKDGGKKAGDEYSEARVREILRRFEPRETVSSRRPATCN